jgi:hypothetical protein
MPDRVAWTDERLDDLVTRIDKQFEALDTSVRELRAEMRELRAEMREFRTEFRTELRDEIAAVRRDGMIGFTTLVAAVIGTGVLT